MSFVAVAAIGIGAASIGVGVASQAAAANEQNAYRQRLGISQNKAFQDNANAVIQDVGMQIDQLARREVEQAAAIRQELDGVVKGARQSMGTMSTQTAAAGVAGRSVDALHMQFQRDVAEFASIAGRNMMNTRAQSSMEAKAIYARGQSAINQGTPNPLPPAATLNVGASILNGVSTGLGAYTSLRGAFSNPLQQTSGAAQTASIINPYGALPPGFGGPR